MTKQISVILANRFMKTIKISCPGKIILMGEHAVVYGRPAIVAAVNRRMTCEIKFVSRHPELDSGSLSEEMLKLIQHDKVVTKIISQIPVGCGMGSSAAWSVVQAASKLFFERSEKFSFHSNNKKIILSTRDLSRINQLAYEYEKMNHGNPSGVDNTVCTYGGILWYKKLKSGKKIFKKIKTKKLPPFILINTGKPTESTKGMVEMVKEKLKKEKSEVNRIFDCLEEQTKLFFQALTMSSLRAERSHRKCGIPLWRDNLIKNCIQNSESCLEDLGVVGELAKKVVREVEKIGGAAKISGAGGIKSGSGIVLCYHPDAQKILDLAQRLNLESFQVKPGEEGVRIELIK